MNEVGGVGFWVAETIGVEEAEGNAIVGEVGLVFVFGVEFGWLVGDFVRLG